MSVNTEIKYINRVWQIGDRYVDLARRRLGLPGLAGILMVAELRPCAIHCATKDCAAFDRALGRKA